MNRNDKIRQGKPRSPGTRAWSWILPPTDSLPRGEVSLTYEAPEGKRPRVHSVYIVIPGRGDEVARTRAFDDGSVVVELDKADRFLGLEVLILHRLKRQDAEFFSEADRMGKAGWKDIDLMLSALMTAHHIWHDAHLALGISAKKGDRKPKRDLLLDAQPDASRWLDHEEDKEAVLG